MKEDDILKDYKTGDSFTAKIEGTLCTGKITIRMKDGTSKIYFCQNEKDGGTIPASEKHGYKNSWFYDDNIHDIVLVRAERIVVNNYPLY